MAECRDKHLVGIYAFFGLSKYFENWVSQLSAVLIVLYFLSSKAASTCGTLFDVMSEEEKQRAK